MRDEAARFLRRHSDEVLAGALSALMLLEVALRSGPADSRLAAAGLAIVSGLAAARRVRHPLPFLGLMLAVTVATAFLPRLGIPTVGSFALFFLLAVYSAPAHTNGRDTVIAAGMTVGLFLFDLLVLDTAGPNLDTIGFYALLYGLPWATGRAVRSRRLKDSQLQAEREMAASAIADERTRIARELHDVVAHSISVMVIQARGGRRVLETAPADARSAFSVIETTGEQALTEMRRLLGMLRRSDDELALAPQPTLARLDALIEQVQAAGLPVHVAVEGEPRELPPGVDLSAYRIVQEALTNTLKHAGPARARIVIRYAPDSLELEIADDGRGGLGEPGAGYGLIGVRERVSVYGGELQAGRQPEGGFALRVRLPISQA